MNDIWSEAPYHQISHHNSFPTFVHLHHWKHLHFTSCNRGSNSKHQYKGLYTLKINRPSHLGQKFSKILAPEVHSYIDGWIYLWTLGNWLPWCDRKTSVSMADRWDRSQNLTTIKPTLYQLRYSCSVHNTNVLETNMNKTTASINCIYCITKLNFLKIFSSSNFLINIVSAYNTYGTFNWTFNFYIVKIQR